MNQVDYLKRLHDGAVSVPTAATEHIQAAIDILETEVIRKDTMTSGVLGAMFNAMLEVNQ